MKLSRGKNIPFKNKIKAPNALKKTSPNALTSLVKKTIMKLSGCAPYKRLVRLPFLHVLTPLLHLVPKGGASVDADPYSRECMKDSLDPYNLTGSGRTAQDVLLSLY